MKGFFAKLLGFIKSKVFILILGFICLALLIWFIGPLIAVAGYEPLSSPAVRFFVLFFIMLCWGASHFITRAKDKKNNDEMVDHLINGSEETANKNNSSEGQEEVELLGKRMQQALDILKNTKLAKGKSVYQLPWYIMIGPPGSGKTSTIHNSGLEYPLKEKMGIDMIQGVAGTRNCDWWFTDQAVLIDTAGRYTTQDSHSRRDSRAWQGFLGLLKKHRPKRPINGVIISMGVSELLNQTKTERNIAARGIKQRLQELQNQLGMKFPVYVLLSKADLIAGFNEFFDDLSDEECEQVFGVTFDLELDNDNSSVNLFNKEFHGLLANINSRVNTRLLHERSLTRKAIIYEFPKQLRLLQSYADDFLKEIFSENAYEEAPMLRGLYLTSSTQEGTPIDQLSNHIGIGSRNMMAHCAGNSRSYFIRHLLEGVIFPERNLATTNRYHDKQNRILRNSIIALSTCTIITLSAMWWQSFSWNSTLIDQTKSAVDNYKEISNGGLNEDTEIIKLTTSLSLIRSLPVGYEKSYTQNDIKSLGLFQGDKLEQPAKSAYKRALHGYLQPYLIGALTTEMQQNSAHLSYLYETLKTYLMLHNPQYYIEEDVVVWFESYFDRKMPGEINSLSRTQLKQHLASLLKYGVKNPKENSDIIKQSREALTSLPLVERAYQRLKSDFIESSIPDFKLIDLFTSESLDAFMFQSDRSFAQGIPGLFTYNGFHGIFNIEKNRIITRLIEDSWVYGDDLNNLDAKTKRRISKQLETKYIRDYIFYWEDFLSDLTVKSYYDAASGAEITSSLSGPDVPLRNIIHEVQKNVNLTKLPLSKNQKAAGEIAKSASEELFRQKKSRIDRLLPKKKLDVEINMPGKEVELAFAEVLEFNIEDIDSTQQTLRSINRYLDKIAYIQPGERLPRNLGNYKKLSQQLRSDSETLPYPFSTWISGIAGQTAQITKNNERQRLDGIWKSQVVSEYRSALAGRYPFKKHTKREVSLKDFGRFFGRNGTLDKFFNSYLKAYVDTSKSPWRFTQDIGINNDVLVMFEKAHKIQNAFFDHGGKSPKIEFNLMAESLDDRINHLMLRLDGQELNYRHGPPRAKQFFWPGTSENNETRIVFTPPKGGRSMNIRYAGTWSFFRLLDELTARRPETKNDSKLKITLNGHKAEVLLLPNSVFNPFWASKFEEFSCPDRL